ncbi:hypothetical protein BDP81DRAFT_389027 [Colletotrichum phormii]|uniref:Uncharacterized protein n=1 Tax=Colletotrichum phormii TaxID=359342 RepID=A0AAJ0A504_9PEZI|nr:uncharacterized protein BDP81DRAFT_389027 [Colletotrichum phormii]KAK1656204.1 hypothetical protein BDP81DRAFT_389027 [Colletotrichum phormii]
MVESGESEAVRKMVVYTNVTDGVVAGPEEELDENVEDDVDDDGEIELLVDDVSEVESEVSSSNVELEDVEEVIELDIESDELEEVASGAAEEVSLVVLEDAEVEEIEDEGKVELEMVVVDSAVELAEDVVKLEKDDSELAIRLAGSIVGLEERDSPVELDEEESDELDVASAELSELDTDDELRSELEEREDVAPVVGDSVDVEARLAGSIVGEADGELLVDVVTEDETDVTSVASSELDWGVVEVDSAVEVPVGDGMEDPVKLAAELDDDRESLSEVLEVVELENVLAEEDVGVIEIPSELVSKLTEVGSVTETLVVTEEEEPVELEEDRDTLSEVLMTLPVEVPSRLRLDEEPEEISEASEVVEESTIEDDFALLDTEEISDEDTELVVVESLDVDSKVLISTVFRVLMDKDEPSEELDIDGGLGSEVEMLDTEELSLVEVPVDVGSTVSGSTVVAMLEDSDEEPAEELVEVPSTESLVDVTVVAELGVSVADGVCGSLLVVELESDEDVGVNREESLDEVAEALFSTPDDEMLDVGDSVSRPIVSEELEDSKDDEVIVVEVDSVIKVLEVADSAFNEVLVDDCWPSELVIDKVVVAAESAKSLDEDDVAPEISLLEVVGSSVVDSDVELDSNVSGLTAILTLEDVEDSVEASSDEETAERSELLDDEEGDSASEEIDEIEVTEEVIESREFEDVDGVGDISDVAALDGGSA